MAEGTAAGLLCYSTQVEAASMLCSSVHGVSAAGPVSCVGVAGASPSLGGAASVSLTMRTLVEGSPVDAPMTVPMLACETYGLDYWNPLLAAWVVAAISILAAKMAYQKFFGAPNTD